MISPVGYSDQFVFFKLGPGHSWKWFVFLSIYLSLFFLFSYLWVVRGSA